MTGREWKPGDVALVNGHVCIKTSRGWEHGDERAFPFNASDPSLDISPLAVIDMENREQVERFGHLLWNITPGADWGTPEGGPYDQFYDDTQAALREFVAPPKPDEPFGLGAVVVDADDRLWVHDPTTPTTHNWHSRGVGRAWHNVDAVRVLSDGYVQGGDEPLADWERDLLRGGA